MYNVSRELQSVKHGGTSRYELRTLIISQYFKERTGGGEDYRVSDQLWQQNTVTFN